MKRMIRLMVTSSAYRQASAERPDLQMRDPQNRLIARQSRLRLPAELVRDAALTASGLLNRRSAAAASSPHPGGMSELGHYLTWKESRDRTVTAAGYTRSTSAWRLPA